MRNLKHVNDYKEFVVKSAGKLRAFRAAAVAVLSLLALSCVKPTVTTVCLNGDCDATMVFPVEIDENGYYHVPLDWNREYYPYFIIEAEADMTAEQFYYGGGPVVSARFDSDTTWIIGDTLVLKQAYYTPFTSEWSSTGGALPSDWRNLNLTQYSGIEVNVAQNTQLYFRNDNGTLKTRRTLGPFPPHMLKDTITVFMEVMWDAGDNSLIKSGFSEKFIVE